MLAGPLQTVTATTSVLPLVYCPHLSVLTHPVRTELTNLTARRFSFCPSRRPCSHSPVSHQQERFTRCDSYSVSCLSVHQAPTSSYQPDQHAWSSRSPESRRADQARSSDGSKWLLLLGWMGGHRNGTTSSQLLKEAKKTFKSFVLSTGSQESLSVNGDSRLTSSESRDSSSF